MTIEVPLWTVPTFTTIISIFWALYYVDKGKGYFSGLDNVLALIPAMFISLISWITYAMFIK